MTKKFDVVFVVVMLRREKRKTFLVIRKFVV